MIPTQRGDCDLYSTRATEAEGGGDEMWSNKLHDLLREKASCLGMECVMAFIDSGLFEGFGLPFPQDCDGRE